MRENPVSYIFLAGSDVNIGGILMSPLTVTLQVPYAENEQQFLLQAVEAAVNTFRRLTRNSAMVSGSVFDECGSRRGDIKGSPRFLKLAPYCYQDRTNQLPCQEHPFLCMS